MKNKPLEIMQKGRVLSLDLLFVILLIAFDQFTKHLAVSRLKGNSAFSLIDGVLELRYTENRGSAFGILQGQRAFLLIIGVVFIGAIVFFLVRLPVYRKFWVLHFLLCGIVAGGLGNLLDRFRLGYVIDFISFILIDYPVFNVADSYVVVCTIALFLLLLFVYKEEDVEQMWKGK